MPRQREPKILNTPSILKNMDRKKREHLGSRKAKAPSNLDLNFASRENIPIGAGRVFHVMTALTTSSNDHIYYSQVWGLKIGQPES